MRCDELKTFTVSYRNNWEGFELAFDDHTEDGALKQAAPHCPQGEGYIYSVTRIRKATGECRECTHRLIDEMERYEAALGL